MASIVFQVVKGEKINLKEAMFTKVDWSDVGVNGLKSIIMPGLENKVVAKFSVEMLTHITEAAFDHDKNVFDRTKPLNDFLLEVGFKSLGVLAGMAGEDFAKAFGDEKGPVIFEAISKMFENTSEYLEKASERKDVDKKKRD